MCPGVLVEIKLQVDSLYTLPKTLAAFLQVH